MKTIVYIFCVFLLSSFLSNIRAQEVENPQEELIDNEWFLIKTKIDEEEHYFYSNEEVSQIILNIDFRDNVYYFSPSFCESLEWSLSFINDYQFSTTFEESLDYTWCTNADNIFYDNFYYRGGFWSAQEDYPFEFYITQEEEHKSLIIIGNENDKAYYQNVPFMSVDKNELSHLNIYPNPVKESFQIENLTEQSNLKIYDISGKEILNQNIHSSAESIEVTQLSSGLYFYGIFQEGRRVKTGKLIKE